MIVSALGTPYNSTPAMTRLCSIGIALLISLAAPIASAAATLDFYTIDVEGGKSVLIVSPSGESMLIDAGWPAAPSREASTDRIVDAVTKAGLQQIDYLVISHFDADHLGDVPALANRLPIKHIVDHGEMQGPSARDRFNAYGALRNSIEHIVVKPGDRIPLKGVTIEVVAAGGRQLGTPLSGAGAPNALCATNPQATVIERDVEDNQSIGLLFTFGSFRMLDLADLEAHYSHVDGRPRRCSFSGPTGSMRPRGRGAALPTDDCSC